MVTFPNAKINLGLFITEKRKDGFHNLESCFYPIPWQDVLEIVPSEKFTFTSSGISIPGDLTTNLCVKVYELIKSKFNIPAVQIHLHKAIPIGAGLGGGSSDASFALKMLNELFELNLAKEEMEDLVRPLGSDCAFFIGNEPVMAFEKGDRFEPLTISLNGYHLIAIYPNIHISTQLAYSQVKPAKPNVSIPDILKRDIKEWKDWLKNDFEDSVFPKYPELQNIKNLLYTNGAIYASMSGSGSCIYGIYDNLPNNLPAEITQFQYKIFEL